MTILSNLNSAILATFGEAVQYTPAGGDAVSVTGIWTDVQGERGVIARLDCALSAFAAHPEKGDTVTRGTTVYKVANDPHQSQYKDDHLANVILELRLS